MIGAIARTVLAFCLGAMLAACSPFSGYVADSWPHFAGGEPSGLPPRPGTPGYATFIAHGQPDEQPGPKPEAPTGGVQHAPGDATVAATNRQPGVRAEPQKTTRQKPAEPNDAVVGGGLY